MRRTFPIAARDTFGVPEPPTDPPEPEDVDEFGETPAEAAHWDAKSEEALLEWAMGEDEGETP